MRELVQLLSLDLNCTISRLGMGSNLLYPTHLMKAIAVTTTHECDAAEKSVQALHFCEGFFDVKMRLLPIQHASHFYWVKVVK